MANSKSTGEYKEYATIDTAPSALGYWTNEVSPRGRGRGIIRALFFSIRETEQDSSAGASGIIPTLQFRCDGDAGWQDYRNDGTAFAIGDCKQVSISAAKRKWRLGVKDGGYTSGSITLGFDW